MRILLVLFIILQSCAFRSYIYRKVPSYITDKLDSALDYTWDEEDTVEKKVEVKLISLKSKLLNLRKTLLETDLSSDRIIALENELSEVFEEFGNFIGELLAEKIARYSKEELAEFIQIQTDKNEEILEMSEKSFDRSEKNISRLFGDLTEKQLLIIKEFSKSSKTRAIKRVENRAYVLGRIKTLYKTNNSVESRESELKTLFENEIAKLNLRNKFYRDFIIEFSKTATNKQKEHFNKKKKEVALYIKEYTEYLDKITQ